MKYTPSIKTLTKNLPLLLSFSALALLNAFSLKRLILAAGVIFLAAAVLSVLAFDHRKATAKASPVTVACAAFAAFFFAAIFFWRADSEGLFLTLGEHARLITCGLAILGGTASIYVVLFALTVSFSWITFPAPGLEDASKRNWKPLAMAFLMALAVLGLCSKSSPLYPFNDWLDSNCFMTMGKSMLYGLVPYRDLYEQKGPLLYMLHALAALVSETSFLGVFLLEVAAATAFLAVCYRILCLYREQPSLLWLALIAAAVYSAKALFHGDSAEELCLPLMAYGLYVGLKAIRSSSLPSSREGFFIGLTSACILWIKFTMLGFYLGWFLAFLVLSLRKKELQTLIKLVGFIILGVAAATAPILLYFALNGALPDLWNVYFFNNIFHYSTTAPSESGDLAMVLSLLEGMNDVMIYNSLTFCFLGLGFLALAKSRRHQELLLILLSGGGLFFLTFMGGQHHRYYSMIFSAFVPAMVPALFGWADTFLSFLKPWMKKLGTIAAPILCCLAAFVLCDNTDYLSIPQSELPQYQFAQIMEEKEDATLLTYGFMDGGFYTVSGIVPNCRFFCRLNIMLDEMYEAQDAYIAEGRTDFVITRDMELASDNYALIATYDYPYEWTWRTYSLYQRTNGGT